MKIDKSLVGKKYLDHNNKKCEIVAVQNGIVRVKFYDISFQCVRHHDFSIRGDCKLFKGDIKEWLDV